MSYVITIDIWASLYYELMYENIFFNRGLVGQ